MNHVNLGYKLIALVAVSGAAYSCSQSVSSQDDSSTAAALTALQMSVETLVVQVNALSTEVAALQTAMVDTGVGACSTPDFLAGACDFPDDAAVTVTYCFSQGIGVDLSAKLAIESATELDLGLGWPNVGWAKASAKANLPLMAPGIMLPNEVAGEAGAGLGRGVDICVDVPFEPNDAQKALIADLVTGVNASDGIQAKYSRRADRLLNYAARRTPVAQVNNGTPGAIAAQPPVSRNSAEEADDAFDLADQAVERFLANGFAAQLSAGDALSDPIFRDLAASVELPDQIAAVIQDPQQMLSGFRSMTPANTCTTLGFGAQVRGRFPAIDDGCDVIAGLPSDQMLKGLGTRMTTLQNRVNLIYTGAQTRDFICDNVTLKAFTPGC